MDAERWKRIDELFHAAVALEGADRIAFIADACGGDASLREELERLIGAHQRASGFMSTSAVAHVIGALAADAGAQPPFARIGSYKIVRELGRGGMGSVYLAERADAQYEKRVAIKLVKRGMDTDTVLAQFRHERQILASLEHPNIARLLDGGTTADGLPYFVMEYIEGRPIDGYCNDHELTIAERLVLFRHVCGAVAYAHQHLVVHRDIKPSNILVMPDGTPKLLDFGIARILHAGEEAGATLAGLRIMTPEYASPEQVQNLRATTLSDVYSLGVVLYELLTGRSPYAVTSESAEEIQKRVITTQPARPSDAVVARNTADESDSARGIRTSEGGADRLHRRLRGDLDTIVLMAMRKERERRYQSVEQLSDDIRRHLDQLPVHARDDTLAYRGSKFLRRHAAAVAAVSAVILSIVAGGIASAWQARRALQQEQIAKIAQARAERRFNEVRKLAHSVLFDYHDAIKELPGATPVRARLVRDALTYLDSLAAEAQSDPSLQRELASAYQRVGDVQGGTLGANLGDTAGAIGSLRKAIALLEAMNASAPNDRASRYALGEARLKLGTMLWETGDMAGGLQTIRTAQPPLEEVLAENSFDLDATFSLAGTLDRIGMIEQEMGDVSAALESYARGLEVVRHLPPAEERNPRTRRALSVAYEHVGTARLLTNELESALASNQQALSLRASLVADFPLNADYRRSLGVSYYNQGEILAKLNRLADALSSYRRALGIADQLAITDPNNEQYRGDAAYELIRVGDMLTALRSYDSAFASYERSRMIRAKDVERDAASLWKRSSLIEAEAKIAKVSAIAGRQTAALSAAVRALALMDKTVVEPTNALIRAFFADTYGDLGEAQATLAAHASAIDRQARWRSARDMYRRSVEIWRALAARHILSQADAPKLAAAEKQLHRYNTMVGADRTSARQMKKK